MSGKKTAAAKKNKNKNTSVIEHAPRKLEIVSPPTVLKLDLASGQTVRDGFEGVDLPGTGAHMAERIAGLRAKPSRTADEEKLIGELEKARAYLKTEINLMSFPWPWADNSVNEIYCSHFVEHLEDIFVDKNGNRVPCGTPGAKDLFFAFFDECYRIMKPDAWMTIIVPCLRNNRAFQDPTHRRFYPAETFHYLFEGFRTANKLDHYNVKCNFDGRINPGLTQDVAMRSADVQQRMFNESWNAISDWLVQIKAVKPGSVATNLTPPPSPTSIQG